MSLSRLNKSMEDIKHAQGFDPVRFTLIQSMHQRVNEPQHKANIILIQNTQKRIDDYKNDLEDWRTKTNNALATIESDLPEVTKQADNFLTQSKFKQIENLLIQEKSKNKRQTSLSLLSDLKNEIGKVDVIQTDTEKTISLDEMLLKQEQDARSDTDSSRLNKQNENQLELQSMKHFRESMKYFNIDKIIARAINDFPENAGPHNPHMLVIKSLMHMHDLSPQYLRRFASYIETVLWLEKNSSKINKKNTT